MSNFRLIYSRPDGGVSVVVPAPGASVEDCIKAVPPGVPHNVVDVSALPADRLFRDAWVADAVNGAKVDLPRARGICHDKRRAKRAAEFAPHDEIIAKQIPGADAVAAEAARAAIRDKYAVIQIEIDAATTAGELNSIVQSLS